MVDKVPQSGQWMCSYGVTILLVDSLLFVFYHLLTYRFITMFAYPTALSYQQHEGALLQFGVKGGRVTKGISDMCHELSQLQRECLID